MALELGGLGSRISLWESARSAGRFGKGSSRLHRRLRGRSGSCPAPTVILPGILPGILLGILGHPTSPHPAPLHSWDNPSHSSIPFPSHSFSTHGTKHGCPSPALDKTTLISQISPPQKNPTEFHLSNKEKSTSGGLSRFPKNPHGIPSPKQGKATLKESKKTPWNSSSQTKRSQPQGIFPDFPKPPWNSIFQMRRSHTQGSP